MVLNTTAVPTDPACSRPGATQIGLALSGGASGGAFTAGVLDFLLEALQQWEQAKRTGGSEVAGHAAELSVVAGTSAGGICAGLLALIASGAYDHVPQRDPDNILDGNVLWKQWVEILDFEGFVKNDDIVVKDGQKVLPSLLNTKMSEEASAELVRLVEDDAKANGVPSKDRALVPFANGMQVWITNGNTRGIPYKLLTPLAGETLDDPEGLSALPWVSNHPSESIDHSDANAFFLSTNNTPGLQQRNQRLKDAGYIHLPYSKLASQSQRPHPAWLTINQASLASSAFPIAFPARTVTVDPRMYLTHQITTLQKPMGYINGLQPGSVATAERSVETTVLNPVWPFADSVLQNPAAPEWKYAAVDGGVTNNDPWNYVTEVLFGGDGHEYAVQTSAVIIVTPYRAEGQNVLGREPENANDITKGSFWGLLYQTLLEHARYADRMIWLLVTGRSKQVRQRFFSITPKENSDLLCAPLDYFGGFFESRFRAHDFFYGRRACQEFLRTQFLLPATSPCFRNCGDAFVQAAADDPDIPKGYLPVIPLCGTASEDVKVVKGVQPMSRAKVDKIMNGVSSRLEEVKKVLLYGRSLSQRAFVNMAWGRFGGAVKRRILENIRGWVESSGLLISGAPGRSA